MRCVSNVNGSKLYCPFDIIRKGVFCLAFYLKQDKIFRRKRLSTGANFVLDCLEIYGTRIYLSLINFQSNR